mgnify:FL=1
MKWSKEIFGVNIGLNRKTENIMATRPNNINKTTFLLITLLASCLAYSEGHQEVHTTSEPVMIPLIDKDMSADFFMPVRGDSESSVEDEFGPPFNMHKAKGKPPISRWDYEKFTVYFESGIVIHSVLRR